MRTAGYKTTQIADHNHTMRIDIIAVLPEIVRCFLGTRIIRRSLEAGLIEINVYDLHDWGEGNYRQIDDAPYGGGGGMVIMPEPLARAIEDIEKKCKHDEIIYMTPDGELLNHELLKELLKKKSLLIICGHYKGIDYRIRQLYVTREISIGDYVVSGGEISSAVLVDALIRLIPGVANNYESITTDSLYQGLLEAPIYTRPRVFRGLAVPDVLLSGDHRKIKEWRHKMALEITAKKRPDLYAKYLKGISQDK